MFDMLNQLFVRFQPLIWTLSLAIFCITESKWVGVEELIGPLGGCQFVLTTNGRWKYKLPALAVNLLNAIHTHGSDIQILSTLEKYKRSDYVLHYQPICIIHLTLHPS